MDIIRARCASKLPAIEISVLENFLSATIQPPCKPVLL